MGRLQCFPELCLSPLEREIILSNRWRCCLWHVNRSSEIIISLMLMWSEHCLILNCFTSKAWECQSIVWLRDLSCFLFNHPVASCSSASCSWLWVTWSVVLVYEQSCLKIFVLEQQEKRGPVLCQSFIFTLGINNSSFVVTNPAALVFRSIGGRRG